MPLNYLSLWDVNLFVARSLKLFCGVCAEDLKPGERAPFLVRIDPKQIRTGAHAGVWIYALSVNRRVRGHSRGRQVSEGYESLAPWDNGAEIELHCKRCKTDLGLTYKEAERQVHLAARMQRTTGYLETKRQERRMPTIDERLDTLTALLGSTITRQSPKEQIV